MNRWRIFGICVAAALGTLCLFGWPYFRKARLIRNIEQLHGFATGYGYMAPNWLRPVLDLLGEPWSSRVVEMFFDDLHTVSLGQVSRTEQPIDYLVVLRELPGAQRLQVLDLQQGRITDEEFRPLGRLRELRDLNLGANRLTTGGMKTLALLGELRKLDLSDSPIDDAALSPLSSLEKLEELDLSGTHVTDEAIPILQSLKSLRHLDLTRTSVSEAACRKLVTQMPHLDISDD